MALQTRSLVMQGLGVLGDHPPNGLQPPLADGIHLRWGSPRERGFPWNGYYLYRRLSWKGQEICLSGILADLRYGEPGTNLETGYGQLSSDTALVFADDFSPAGQLELDLQKRKYVRFALPDNSPARRIKVVIGFYDSAVIEVSLYSMEAAVKRTILKGEKGDIRTEAYEFDLITAVEISSGAAAMIELCFVPVSQNAGNGWQKIPGCPYPITLPVFHPDYPPFGGKGVNLSLARNEARKRIRYGSPDRLAGAPVPLYMTGKVSVMTGSSIVRGNGTDWNESLIGAILQVDGDSTAYGIADVPAHDKLVLSARYTGVSGIDKAYAIVQDSFASLHDQLIRLVEGGPAGEAMYRRMLPEAATTLGTATVTEGSDQVIGTGTGWTSDLEGLAFKLTFPGAGTVAVSNGSPVVTGSGTAWSADLTGMSIGFPGEQTSYTIIGIDSPTLLQLDRPYQGLSGTGRAIVIEDRASYIITRVDSLTGLTLDRPYFGVNRINHPYRIVPPMPRQYPLDLVLLASIDPAAAQMLGLYWVDQSAEKDKAYDYLILAQPPGLNNLDPDKLLAWLESDRFAVLDGFIVFNKRLEPAQALEAPKDLRVYALPGATIEGTNGQLVDASVNAGLRWGIEAVDQPWLLSGEAVMYHIWRARLGEEDPLSEPTSAQYEPITKEGAVVVPRSLISTGKVPVRAADWPPFPLYSLDQALSEGWYSYRVSGIDLYGRHSLQSDASRWFQWQPAPNPAPWYYNGSSTDSVVHPYAVHLLDKLPPPAPTGVEAFALDPDDPTLLRDAVYQAWYDSLSASEQQTVIGLRARWIWTQAHMEQSPDTREFRIYYQPGPVNVRLGRTAAVAYAGGGESMVETDLSNTEPANAYTGTWLRVGTDSFKVTGSEAGSPLKLRVHNLGASGTTAPRAAASCALSIPEGHALHVDYSESEPWQARYFVVDYNDTDCFTVQTDSAGRTIRSYEVLLPGSGGTGLPLIPSLAEPVVYAQIGVSAADDKTHTADSPKWSAGMWGGRYGNEGRIGAPATVFRVLRTPPGRPEVPPDSERVWATPADYHSRSYYTYRWKKADYVKAHIFRALDDTLFRTDWLIRSTRGHLDPANPQHDFFPAEWTMPRKQAAASQLNVIAALSDYAALSADARTVLAMLPGNAAGVKAGSFAETDWRIRRTRMALLTNDNAYFPADWTDMLKKQRVVDELNGIDSWNSYRTLTNDGMRVLAGLPGNEAAFSQLTVQPLDPGDPANADRVGPDNPPDQLLNADLRAYIDTLDGRSANRYFYRTAYVDEAHNRGELSLSSPPVWLPNVVPPRAPVLTKVVGGDRSITLKWVSNREEDLTEYRIFRADDKEKADDLRLMTYVHTVAVAAGDPLSRPEELDWTDHPVPGLRPFYYRIAAVDEAGNVSAPSELFPARAYDQSIPAAPVPTVEWLDDGSGSPQARIGWTSADETLLQGRRAGAMFWTNLGDWQPPGVHTVTDGTSDSLQSYEYRLRARGISGATSVGSVVTLAADSS